MDTGKTTGEISRESGWGKMEPRPGGGMGMERRKSSAQILVTDGREGGRDVRDGPSFMAQITEDTDCGAFSQS